MEKRLPHRWHINGGAINLIGLEIMCKSNVIDWYPLLQMVEWDKYEIWCQQLSVYGHNELIEPPCSLAPSDLQKMIQGGIYIDQMVLALFPKEVLPRSISTIEMYFEEACKILLLISDGSFLELYAKDEVLLGNVFNYSNKLSHYSVSVKTKAMDFRTEVFV